MNSALLLLNAIAIAVLAAFHFQPAEDAARSGFSTADYSLRQAPQLAVMNTQATPGETIGVTREHLAQKPAEAPVNRWVF